MCICVLYNVIALCTRCFLTPALKKDSASREKYLRWGVFSHICVVPKREGGREREREIDGATYKDTSKHMRVDVNAVVVVWLNRSATTRICTVEQKLSIFRQLLLIIALFINFSAVRFLYIISLPPSLSPLACFWQKENFKQVVLVMAFGQRQRQRVRYKLRLSQIENHNVNVSTHTLEKRPNS